MIGIPGSHSSAISSPLTSPPLTTASLEPRVSVFSFFKCCAFFGRLPFALLVLPVWAALSSVSLVNCLESSSLFWPLWPPVWLPRLLPTGGGNRTFPWLLVWDSWPPLSFALPDQPPPPDHLENHLICADSIQVIPLAWCRMSLELLVGTRKFLTTLLTLSLQLWN